MDEIQVYLTGTRARVEPDRVLATILFTDIVDATRHASKLGDRAWRDLISGWLRIDLSTAGTASSERSAGRVERLRSG
jgi:class 3 adenylate cyclase